MLCLTAWGRWAVENLSCTATLPGGGGHWNSCNAPPHCVGAVGNATLASALPHCSGAVGSGTPAMNCLIACGQWVVELLLCTATLSEGSGLWNCCNALPHPVGSTTPAVHGRTAWGRRAVELLQCAGPLAGGMGSPAQEAVAALRAELLQYTGTLPQGSGQCNSCNARAHQLGGRGVLHRRRSLPK